MLAQSRFAEGKFCPVGGQPVMSQVASILGLDAGTAEPMVAVVRCNGTCTNRPRTNMYDGAKSCAIAASLYGGETGCSYGCLGCGDCVAACQFDAIHMNPETDFLKWMKKSVQPVALASKLVRKR